MFAGAKRYILQFLLATNETQAALFKQITGNSACNAGHIYF